MGKDKRNTSLANTSKTAGQQYSSLYGSQTPLEKELIPQSQEMYNNFNRAMGTQTQDYGNIMGGYQDFAKNMAAPTTYTPQQVGASSVGVSRPEELTKGYGFLEEAAPGYRTFAETGGYTPQDIQELRARGTAPIRSAYSNSMMEMDRARALGGSAGSPNYIAALSRMQRELPEQLSTATTGVNAQLADAIRQGKLSGLSGLTGIGTQMGGLASAESGRQLQAGIANQGASLQAGIANQGAGLQAAGLNQNALNSYNQAQLNSLGGQAGLYGTTPAMAATFGGQALNSMGQRLNAEQMRNQQGLNLLDTQLRGTSAQTPSTPWWKTALNVAGSVVPYLGSAQNLLGMGGGGNGIGSMGEQVQGMGFQDPYGNSNIWDGYNFGNEGGYTDPYFNGVPPGGETYNGGW